MSPRVAIIIPTLNEAERIGSLLAQFSREPEDCVVNIFVADGGSTDGTRAIVREASVVDNRISLIDNPGVIQSAGMNRAAAMIRADVGILIRVDAHAGYPNHYVKKILDAFAQSGAAMVAIRLNSHGFTARQRGIAAASNSRFGTGGSAHRVGGFSGFVDHGHHAGMNRAMFDQIGGYDESFAANEDAEFDARVRAAGGQIWLAGEIEIAYHPRGTFYALVKQYRRYGQGRAQNWAKHREPLRLRQMAPVLAVGACSAALMLAFLLPLLLVIPATYIAMILLATFGLLVRTPRFSTLFAAPAMIVMHWAWGIGFIFQALKSVFGKQRRRFTANAADDFQTEKSY
jgi:succinoglycan biosynthesis protein ExoA